MTTCHTVFGNHHQPSELDIHGLRQVGETWNTVSVVVKYDKQSGPYTAFLGCVSDTTQRCCMCTRNAHDEAQTSVRMNDEAGTQHSLQVHHVALNWFFLETGAQHLSYAATFDYELLLLWTSLRYHSQPMWLHSLWKRIKGPSGYLCRCNHGWCRGCNKGATFSFTWQPVLCFNMN